LLEVWANVISAGDETDSRVRHSEEVDYERSEVATNQSTYSLPSLLVLRHDYLVCRKDDFELASTLTFIIRYSLFDIRGLLPTSVGIQRK
jgi:hypothetical protein